MYELRLLNEADVLISPPATFTAVNPIFNLTLPSKHTAQEDVHPTLNSRFLNRRVSCKPSSPKFEYKFEVRYKWLMRK